MIEPYTFFLVVFGQFLVNIQIPYFLYMTDHLKKTIFATIKSAFITDPPNLALKIFFTNSDKKIFNYSILQNRIVGRESSDTPTTCIHLQNLFVCVGISIMAHNYVSL